VLAVETVADGGRVGPGYIDGSLSLRVGSRLELPAAEKVGTRLAEKIVFTA